MSQKTSPRGRAALRLHEGDVLKAYRCPAGRWTIGPGLTKASGVVDPKPGMTITAEESDRLLSLALGMNYEPAVAEQMPDANQGEFDGAVSFHFNTGAIARASWVKKWRVRDWVGVKKRLYAWNKGGGKVLSGLTRRRADEFSMIRYGMYPGAAKATPQGCARVVISMDTETLEGIRASLRKLGYEPGAKSRGVSCQSVRDFQRDHGLTADGIIGAATLSTLQRMLDARSKAVAPTVAVSGSSSLEAIDLPTTGPEAVSAIPALEWVIPVAIGLSLIWLAWRAWQYRDAVAAKAQTRFPTLAAKLRSI